MSMNKSTKKRSIALLLFNIFMLSFPIWLPVIWIVLKGRGVITQSNADGIINVTLVFCSLYAFIAFVIYGANGLVSNFGILGSGSIFILCAMVYCLFAFICIYLGIVGVMLSS